MGFVVAFLCLETSAQAAVEGLGADLTLGSRFDEGALGVPDGLWTLSATPRLRYTHAAAQSRLDLDARRRFDSLKDDRSPRPANDALSGSIMAESGPATRFEAAAHYYGTRDLVSLDPRTATAPGLTSDGFGALRASVWRAEAAYDVESRTHAETALADAWSQTASAALFPLRSPAGAVLVRGEYQDWTFNDTLSLSAVTGMAGYRRLHTALLSTEGEIGAVEVKDELRGDRETRLAWSAGINGLLRAFNLPVDSRVRVQRGVTTEVRAEVSRTLQGAAASASWSRSLAADGGAFATPTVRDFASVGVEDSLSAATVLSVRGTYGRWRPRDTAGQRIETLRFTGSIARALGPWLWGRAGYSYLQQDQTATSGFHRGRAEVQVTATFR